MSRRAPLFLIPAALLVALDRVTKLLAEDLLTDPIVLINGVLELRLVHNTGAAFGMLSGLGGLFIVFALLAALYCFFLFLRLPTDRRFIPFSAALIGIAAGALGNLIDRVTQSFVTDFIYFSLIDFPVFNVADILVTTACIGLIILFAFYYGPDDLSRIHFGL